MGGTVRAVATKARHLKTPMQRWVFDHLSGAKDLAQDIAIEAGVSVETVRGWQSRGRPPEHAVQIMERRFGEAAPREDQPAPEMATLIAALQAQTDAISALVARLDSMASTAIREGVLDALREAGVPPGVGASLSAPPHEPSA